MRTSSLSDRGYFWPRVVKLFAIFAAHNTRKKIRSVARSGHRHTQVLSVRVAEGPDERSVHENVEHHRLPPNAALQTRVALNASFCKRLLERNSCAVPPAAALPTAHEIARNSKRATTSTTLSAPDSKTED